MMARQQVEFTMSSADVIQLIPKYDGSEGKLNHYLELCEYVINTIGNKLNPAQDLFVLQVCKSKLIGRAAELISQRQDIVSWAELKQTLQQSFGDLRTEECIAIELETLKIDYNESYRDFCHRIKRVRYALQSKVNLIEDENIRRIKGTIYDHMAMNVFLYNIPEDLIRVIRSKDCTTLDEAVSVAITESSFYSNLYAKKGMLRLPIAQNSYLENFYNKQTPPRGPFPHVIPETNKYRFGFPSTSHIQGQSGLFGASNAQPNRLNSSTAGQGITQSTNTFSFGIPNQGFMQRLPAFQQSYRPNLAQDQLTFGTTSQKAIENAGVCTVFPVNSAHTNQIKDQIEIGIEDQNRSRCNEKDKSKQNEQSV